MKIVTLLAIAVFASCAVTDQPQTSSTSSALTEMSESESWDPKNTSNDLWPTGAGITATNVLYRKAPDQCSVNGGAPQPCVSCTPSLTVACVHSYLAFVVWNQTTVGHIYWIPETSLGTDFHQTLDNTFAARCNTSPDHWLGGDGGTATGTPPVPHPNVTGFPSISFSTNYLGAAKTAAQSIHDANTAFSAYTE